jgi:hypothetical protein
MTARRSWRPGTATLMMRKADVGLSNVTRSTTPSMVTLDDFIVTAVYWKMQAFDLIGGAVAGLPGRPLPRKVPPPCQRTRALARSSLSEHAA